MVNKKIKKSNIKIKKTGPNFITHKKNFKNTLTLEQKKELDKALKKTFKEYGETLRLLGKN